MPSSVLRLLVCIVLGLSSAAVAAQPADPVTLTVVCGGAPTIHAFCDREVRRWARQSGVAVRIAAAPSDVNARLRVYRELLEVAEPGLDVLEIDVTWPGVLSKDLLDLAPLLEGSERGISPALLKNNRVAGRQVALPWFLDFGVLFYRKDLLDAAGVAVPEDWESLQDTALAVQSAQRDAGNGRFWGYVWQGWRAESLVCNALEWLAGSEAGQKLANGEVRLDYEDAVAAFDAPLEWLGSISPESVLSFTEDESLAVFAAGNAAFLRQWPGAWALLSSEGSPLRGKVGIAPVPRALGRGRHPGALGGWQLAVSRYSRHPEHAADLVRYLTSPEVQRRMALQAHLLPVRLELYEDEEVQAALPAAALLAERRIELIPRPSLVAKDRYPRMSRLMQESFYDVLSRHDEPQAILSRLVRQIAPLLELENQW